MELNDKDYIGLFSGVYSRDYGKDPIKFLSKKENIWYGANVAIFYPEVMEWDIICSMPTGPSRRVDDIFFRAAVYGDNFSIVDSVHGICDDCEIERFDIRASNNQPDNVYMRAVVKVRNFIPYNHENDFQDSNPTEILKNSYYSENPVSPSWFGNMVKSDDVDFEHLFMIGLGDINSHWVHLTLQSQDKNKHFRKGQFSVHFAIPIWGGIADDQSRVLSNLNNNIKLASSRSVSAGNMASGVESIKENDTFVCEFGPFSFILEDVKKGNVNKVIEVPEDEEDEDSDPDDGNLQIFSIKLMGILRYKMDPLDSDD